MNEILTYIGTNRRKVTVGYELNGELVRVHRKIDGTDKETIQNAVDELRQRGVSKIVLEVFRPNGNSMLMQKKFELPNNSSATMASPKKETGLSGSPTLFPLPPAREKEKPVTKTTQSPQSKSMESTSWKDYALTTEKEKVAKLEAEVRRLSTENRTLDTKVREFEKEMIKKDFELEKMHGQVERKSGLEGVMERAADNPKVMDFIAGLGSRIFGMPEAAPQQSLNAAPESTGNPETDQYIANIRAWLVKQPIELQQQFYQLVYEITNSQNVSENIIRFTNLLQNKNGLRTAS